MKYIIKTKRSGKTYTQQESEQVIEEICQQAKFSRNGDFIYEGIETRIPIKCDKCGNEWSPTFKNIKKGYGCKNCFYVSTRNNEDDIIDKLKEASNGRYIWNDFNYEGINQVIKLHCLKDKNHTWEAPITRLINYKTGCPHCKVDDFVSSNKKSQDEVERQLKEVGEGRFTYEPFVYEFYRQRIKVNCLINPIHKWETTIDSLINAKSGCPECNKESFRDKVRKSQEEVEKELKKVLAGKYTYTPFVYKNSSQMVKLHCKKHNTTWETSVANALKEPKCKRCLSDELFGETLKTEVKSKERRDFRNSMPINENLVRFNMMGYNMKEKRFKAFLNTLKLDFVLKAKNYSLLKPYWYTTKDVRISLKCNKDGHEWTTSLGEIIRGSGCMKCSRIKSSESQLKSKEQVLKELDGLSKNKYSYNKDFEYKGIHNTEKISCKCLVCGNNFETNLNSLFQGHGCRKCASKVVGDRNRLDKEDVLERLKENSEGKYIWEDFEYKTISQKIKLQCLKNSEHKWEASISALTSKSNPSGWPHCNPKYSKIETKIREYVESIVEPYGLEVEANNRSIIPSLKDPRFFMEIDIFTPCIKTRF